MIDDETRAEARRRYEPSKLVEDYDGDRYVDDEWGYDECQRRAFVAGAEWQASRPITDEQVEAAAKVLYADYESEYEYAPWELGDQTPFLTLARAALEAARGVQS